MFLDHVYRVAQGKAQSIPLKQAEVKVTDSLYKECQLIRMLHVVSIGVFTVLGSSVSALFGEASFLRDLLFIAVFLTVLTFIYNKTAYYLIQRKFGKNGG